MIVIFMISYIIIVIIVANFFQMAIVVPPPRNLMVASKTSNSIILSWEPPDRTTIGESIVITGYVVEWSNSQSSTVSTNPIILITGLIPYERYQVSVKAVYTGNNTGEKTSIEITTFEEGILLHVTVNVSKHYAILKFSYAPCTP